LYGAGSTFILANDSDAAGVTGVLDALVVEEGAGSIATVVCGRSLFEAHATNTHEKSTRFTRPS
jgi:hypothetical protein